MTDRPLFFYGTLRDAHIRDAVLGRPVEAHQLIAAWALDHQAVYFPGQLYPALVRRIGSSAAGLLLTEATAADRAALDRFEGELYRRDGLLVTTAAGPITAEAYWPVVEIPATALPWTLEHWLAAHKATVLAQELALAGEARHRRLDP